MSNEIKHHDIETISEAIANTITFMKKGELGNAIKELGIAEKRFKICAKQMPQTEALIATLHKKINQEEIAMCQSSVKNKKTSTIKIAVNLTKIDFDATMGVLYFGKNLVRAVANIATYLSNVYLVVPAELKSHPVVHGLLGDNVHIYSQDKSVDIEIKLHHFQKEMTKAYRLLTLVHDFHVFDVPWKYKKDAYRMQGEVIANIFKSDAVFTHFPRTYSILRSMVNEKAFLTVSPMMLPIECGEKIVNNNVIMACEGPQTKILYPAQFQAHKNHFNLLKACRHVIDQGEISLKLILTGSIHDKAYHNQVLKAISELKLQNHICILGLVSDYELNYLYKKIDLVVQPSLAEGGAYIAQEAVTFQKPVVASNIPQVTQHLSRMGGDWKLFDPLDHISIAKAVSEQIKAKEVNSVAAETIKDWSWEVYRSEIEEIIKKILHKP